MDDTEIIREFLIESTENLARLDQEMIEIEKRPGDAGLLASIFRTIHTIKGTCGFLGFSTMESTTHVAETILSQVRNGERELTPGLVTLILSTVDAVRKMLAVIEETGHEPADDFADLRARLLAACSGDLPPSAAVAAKEPPEVPPVEYAPAPTSPSADEGDPVSANSTRMPAAADATIRVDVLLLDKLVTLVGELVLARNQILGVSSSENPALQETSQRLDQITSELQESVMRTRMQPIGVVWGKLPRVVRDLTATCGKQISIEMDGASTEIDKTIIEAIKDPLTHIVRNACDHGLETPEVRLRKGKPATGRLSLRAWHEGGYVKIEITDDGAGINPEIIRRKAVQKGLLRSEQADRLTDREAIKLVFAPGFSTAEKVTNISGRGVGMDVVRTNVEKIGGTLELTSVVDQGTSVQVRIPLTLAIIPGLLVHCGGEQFVIPQVSLVELVRLEGPARAAIQDLHGSSVFRRRGRLVPLAFLDQVLGLKPSPGAEAVDAISIVILQAEQQQFGLVVETISDTQEIVVKALGKQLKSVPCYAGATIMGDGRVALILDVMGIGQLSGVLRGGSAQKELSGVGEHAEADAAVPRSYLLFRAGRTGRMAVPLELVARLEEIPADRVEYAAGKLAVQYRDSLLPLISLAESLGRPASDEAPEVHRVIVISRDSRNIGLMVDEIIDIVEESLGNIARSGHHGLLGSCVLGGRLTDLVDVAAVIEAAEPGWLGEQRPSHSSTVLLADPSVFSRSMVRSSLEAEGYRVLEASTAEEARNWLGRRRVDALLLSGAMPASDIPTTAPVMVCPVALERRQMVDSLQNLLAAVEGRSAIGTMSRAEVS